MCIFALKRYVLKKSAGDRTPPEIDTDGQTTEEQVFSKLTVVLTGMSALRERVYRGRVLSGGLASTTSI